MTIEERASGGVTILDVRGRMTIETLPSMLLAGKVRQLLQQGRTRIILKLEGVPYADTTGLSNIVEAQARIIGQATQQFLGGGP